MLHWRMPEIVWRVISVLAERLQRFFRSGLHQKYFSYRKVHGLGLHFESSDSRWKLELVM